ncbi:MAG: hypothetical protein NVS9B10_18340 [Nevskia sp.]
MGHRPSGWHRCALWLALGSVLLRGLVPAGFMPGWTQAGTDGRYSWLTICPAGELQALLPQDPHAQHHHHPGAAAMPAGTAAAAAGMDHSAHRLGEAHLSCPFAAAAAPGLPVALAALALPAPGLAFVAAQRPPGPLATRLRRLPPARGPPRQADPI